MIVETKLNGRPCQAMYMTEDFEPVNNQLLATLVKVTFLDDEGGILFLVPKAHTDLGVTEQTKSANPVIVAQRLQLARERASAAKVRAQQMQVARARAERLLKASDHWENQPREPAGSPEGGRFAGGPGAEGGDAGKPAAKPIPTAPPPTKAGRQTGYNAPGSDQRVSTTVPAAAAAKKQGLSPHQQQNLQPSMETFDKAMKSVAPGGELKFKNGINKLMDKYGETGQKSAAGTYVPFVRFPPNATPEQKVEAFVEHAKENVKALYGQYGDYRERAKLWYEGANKIANDLAAQYGVSPRAVAGVIASLSPQRDWDQNVEMARRLLEYNKNKDVKFSDDVAAKTKDRMDGFAATQRATADKVAAEVEELKAQLPEGYDPKSKEPKLKALLSKIRGKELTVANALDRANKMDELGPLLQGRSLSDFKDKFDQAMVIRFHDEATAEPDRSYPLWNPEGTPSGKIARNNPTKKQEAAGEPGSPKKTNWSTFGFTVNGLSVLEDDSRENISQVLGERFKIRNFYNNIISPNFGQDTTIDTHAIAAGTLMPMGGSHPIVSEGLGSSGPGNAETGLKGTYALYYEAYRRAAAEISAVEEREILPREMQSITWEALRGLYGAEDKRDVKLEKEINGIWQRYHDGKIELADAQQEIFSRGIERPRWA